MILLIGHPSQVSKLKFWAVNWNRKTVIWFQYSAFFVDFIILITQVYLIIDVTKFTL